ncbi:hypothetical protein [Paenibacillus polymyxa]|uniref:hypothetical protein n=1 Tax=Paenibacillus polymyxa TaxID=1406 RepID=UPI003216CDBA
MKLEYDITTYENSLFSLSQFTKQGKGDIEDYILLNSHEFSADHFLKEFQIDESNLLENDLWLTSLHVTTNNDNCTSLKKYGLINLQQAISLDTPFKHYLKEFGITFDLIQRSFNYKSNTYDISREFNAFSTDTNELQLQNIAYKLYEDHQVNGFFSYDNVLTYGGYVNKRPEFLLNLSSLLKLPNLVYNWERNNKCYVIKFIVPINDYIDWTFINKSELLYLDQEEIDITKRKWLINETLSNIYEGFFHQTLRDIYSYLRPNLNIPSSNFVKIYTEDEYLKAYSYKKT